MGKHDGKRFGKWVVLASWAELNASGNYVSRIKVRCDCGVERVMHTASVTGGKTMKCQGCANVDYAERSANTARKKTEARLKREELKEAAAAKKLAAKAWPRKTHHPLYNTWTGMIDRCYSAHPDSDNGRYWRKLGIRVCDRWRNDFWAFVEDMGPRPEGTSLDRFPDKQGDYAPENCRWATSSEQNSNRTPPVGGWGYYEGREFWE